MENQQHKFSLQDKTDQFHLSVWPLLHSALASKWDLGPRQLC